MKWRIPDWRTLLRGRVSAPLPDDPISVPLAVCGAHLSGEPLNGELTGRGARLLRACRTAPAYRLLLLAGGPPRRPGMVRLPTGEPGGAAIVVEVWDVPTPRLGGFLVGVPAPLCIGSVELEDGSRVAGFLCEGHAARDAEDITGFGGWRAFLASGGAAVRAAAS